MTLKKTYPMRWNDGIDRDNALMVQYGALPKGGKLGRITEYHGVWNYTLWGTDPLTGVNVVNTRYMHDDMRPDWMVTIVAAALVGGHVQRLPDPPPTIVIWFETDSDMALVKFLQRGTGGKADVS